MATVYADTTLVTTDSTLVTADGYSPGAVALRSAHAHRDLRGNPNVVYRTTASAMVPRARVITDVSAFFGITNADVIAVGEDVKAGELYNVMSTIVGDEPFLASYGCDLPKRVFEPITAALMQLLTLDVYMTAKTWVPDALVSTADCRAVAAPGNRLAGVVVGYHFAGSLWHLPINLVEIGNP